MDIRRWRMIPRPRSEMECTAGIQSKEIRAIIARNAGMMMGRHVIHLGCFLRMREFQKQFRNPLSRICFKQHEGAESTTTIPFVPRSS